MVKSIVGVETPFISRGMPRELVYIADLLSCVDSVRIVDIGCGNSAKGVHLSLQAGSRSSYVVSVDLSWSAVKGVAKLMHELGIPGDAVQADAHMLPFRSRSFDIAILWNVLMFVLDDKLVLQESDRILSYGGMVALSTYDTRRAFRSYDLARLIRRTMLYFDPVSIRNTGSQIMVLAQKRRKGSTSYHVLRIPATKVEQALKEFQSCSAENQELSCVNADGYVLLLIPQRPYKDADIEQSDIHVNSMLSKTYAVAMTYFYSSYMDKLFSLLSKLCEENRCLYNTQDLRQRIAALGVPRGAINKALNDLARLGVVRKASALSEVLSLCEFSPMVSVEDMVALNPVLFRFLRHLKVRNCMHRDKLYERILTVSIITGNPIVRNVLRRIYIEYDGKASMNKLMDLLADNIKIYWSSCSKTPLYANTQNDLQEVSRISDRKFFQERFLEPYARIGVVSLRLNDKIELSEYTMHVLEEILY